MKEQSKQWTANGESAPKKVKTVSSAGKVMIIFWDSRGIVFIEHYLKKGKTIMGMYFALIDKLQAKIVKKRPHLKKKKVMFH